MNTPFTYALLRDLSANDIFRFSMTGHPFRVVGHVSPDVGKTVVHRVDDEFNKLSDMVIDNNKPVCIDPAK